VPTIKQKQFLNCFWVPLREMENFGLRVRVDHGVENVGVCDTMEQVRREERGSFTAGPSTN